MFKQPNNVELSLRNKTNASVMNDNVLDKNSNITTTKTKSRPRSRRTTKDNGLKLTKNVKQNNLHEELEKSSPLVKANLKDKNNLEVLSNTVDLPAKNVSSCLTADEPCDGNSSNEDSCKGDESRISVDEDLTLRFSQDPIMSESQDGDPMCDVRWDYGSPEIVKKVKKRRGHFSAESVKMALANFSDAHIQPQKESFNYVGVMLQHPSYLKPEKSKVNRAKQRALKKNQHGFQEMMVSFLQDLTKRQGSVLDSNNASSTQISSTSDQPVDDNLAETGNQELGDSDVNYWSDEDLFKDNSLLMEATYNPEKFVTMSPGVDKRLSSSISDSNTADLTSSSHDTSVIPSSCLASCVDSTYKPKTLHCTSSTLQSHKPIQSRYTHSNKTQVSNAPVKSCLQTNKTNTSSTVVSSNTWTTTSSNTLSGKSSQSNTKVALKKYNSFHIDAPNTSVNNHTDKSHAVTPLRKTLSFDYSHSSQSSVQKPLSSNYAPSLSNNKVKLNAPKVNLFSVEQSVQKTGHTKTLTPTDIRTFSLEEDNLPEDVIQQLLEPDEILDSQDYNPVKPSSMIVSLPKPENKTTFQFKSVNKCDNKTVNSNQNLNRFTGSNSSNRLHSVTNSSLSKPVHTRPSVNPNQGVQRVSSNPVQALIPPALQKSPKQFYGQAPPPKFIQKSSHHTSTPVKGENKGVNGPEQSDTCAKSQVLSDSFIENVFNDSFLNDEALYESQILPLLDQVESEAMRESQSSQQPKSSPPTQCSPDEIERKRQAALQKRMFSLSQRKNLQ